MSGKGLATAPAAEVARELRTRMLLARLEAEFARHEPSPPRLFPERRWTRALVVAPHADDEVIGCGGLIRRLVEAGTEVAVVFLTLEAGARGRVRRIAESRAAQGVLGYAYCRQLALPDRGLSGPAASAGARLAIAEALARWRPDLLVLPGPGDFHPDHAAAGAATLAARRDAARAAGPVARHTALAYEVWGPCPATWYLPLSERLVRMKRKALECYASQLETADYRRVMAFVHERRAAVLRDRAPGAVTGGAAWAEGFAVLDPGPPAPGSGATPC